VFRCDIHFEVVSFSWSIISSSSSYISVEEKNTLLDGVHTSFITYHNRNVSAFQHFIFRQQTRE